MEVSAQGDRETVVAASPHYQGRRPQLEFIPIDSCERPSRVRACGRGSSSKLGRKREMHSMLKRRSTLARFAVVLLLSSPCAAQLADWANGFEVPGVNGSVYSICTFDDGSGPAVYIGGSFSFAGSVPVTGIARWRNGEWSSVGSGANTNGFSSNVNALVAFDDGSGPALYAGGSFSQIGGVTAPGLARWNGTYWAAVGTGANGPILTLKVVDLGTGPSLYAAGSFFTIGGLSTRNVARWTGSGWAALGGGLGGSSSPEQVSALAVFDDHSGAGPALYAGGQFKNVGTPTIESVARWNGTQWLPLANGLESFADVRALEVFDDGSGGGLELYVGGSFFTASGMTVNNIARWNGLAWTGVGGGVFGGTIPGVETLHIFDDGQGAGPALYAAGGFQSAEGAAATKFARWNGSHWEPLNGFPGDDLDHVHVLATDDLGSTPVLLAGGGFHNASRVNARGIAQWDHGEWSALGRGSGLNGPVLGLLAYDDGNGHEPLVAAGKFTLAGSSQATGIATWDGATWSPLGTGIQLATPQFDEARALCVHDDGLGQKLYAGGEFFSAGGIPVHNIASWDGAAWSALGAGVGGGSVYALATWRDSIGPALYAGGDFLSAGGQPAHGIARWRSGQWSTVGGSVNGEVYALLPHHEAAGSVLYVAGGFDTVGQLPAKNVAKWDGSNWQTLGDPMLSTVWALALFNDGSGAEPTLYAAGSSGHADGICVRRWNGASWTAVTRGTDETVTQVYALVVYNDRTGGGPALYAGGNIAHAGTSSAHYVARWNGQLWQEVGSGTDASVRAFAVRDEGPRIGSSLYVGGYFGMAGNKPASYIGRLTQASVVGSSFCYGDGVDPMVTVSCPCGNEGLPAHGCANSSFHGSRLWASGTIPGLVTLTATGLPPASQAILFSSATIQSSGYVFGDGISCLSGTLHRLAIQVSNSNAATFPAPAEPPGAHLRYQVFYRDSSAAFCPPAAFNVSSGIEITW